MELTRLKELAELLTEQAFNAAKVGDQVTLTATALKPPKTWNGILTKIYPDGTVDINFFDKTKAYQGPGQSDVAAVKAKGQGTYDGHDVAKTSG